MGSRAAKEFLNADVVEKRRKDRTAKAGDDLCTRVQVFICQRTPDNHDPTGLFRRCCCGAERQFSILNSPFSIALSKYQLTRYSQLSTFGLIFQMCEMYEEK